ncbi:MAG: hypothetical protein ABJA80_07810 [bacterium]
MLRRLTAALMSLAMLHLSVTAALGVCGGHGAMPAPDHASMHLVPAAHGASAHHGGAMHAAAMTRAAMMDASTLPCNTPAVPRCCEAVAGCSLAWTLEANVQQIASRPDGARVDVVPGTTSSSFAPAPEPPPPKA